VGTAERVTLKVPVESCATARVAGVATMSGRAVGRTARPRASGPGVRGAAGAETAGDTPAPQRSRSTWRQFLGTQASTMLACDFFPRGLRGDCAPPVGVVRDRAGPRYGPVRGVTAHPGGAQASQQARNLLMD
jgi:hypothetical protein